MSTNAKKRKSLRERRKIQRRKLQIRAAAALLSLVAVTFLLIFHFTPQNTQADSEPKAPTYKYYTSIRVSSGDTLWISPKNTVQKNTPIFPVTLLRSVRSIT